MIQVLSKPATRAVIADLLQETGRTIKVAVDVRLGVLAAGGDEHYDCEQVLLDEGSEQTDIWGATWNSETGEISYWSVINARSGHRSTEIQSRDLRARIESIVRHLLEVSL